MIDIDAMTLTKRMYCSGAHIIGYKKHIRNALRRKTDTLIEINKA